MESNRINCRHCDTELNNQLINLGKSPPSNAYLKSTDLDDAEYFYPLKVFVCEKCFLVQIPEYKSHEDIFNDQYAYFSSYSKSWLEHAFNFVEQITEELRLNHKSLVTEIASNDGYLLHNFIKKGIPCLGVEPTQNTAIEAQKKGINTVIDFFTEELSKTLKKLPT